MYGSMNSYTAANTILYTRISQYFYANNVWIIFGVLFNSGPFVFLFYFLSSSNKHAKFCEK